MSGWLVYLKERFPVPVYALLSGGFSVSGLLLASGKMKWGPFALSFIGLFLFLGVLRLMDELKDYEKDKIAHPERPLPRGLIDPKQVEKLVNALVLGMFFYAAISGMIAGAVAGSFYLGITVFLWLMYKEFFVGEWLNKHTFLYGITHQFIILIVCGYAVAVSRPELALATPTLFLGLSIVGAFFSYEVCRKLDPKAHPLLQTYLSVAGPTKTSLFVVALCAIAALGAYKLGLGILLWPTQALVILSLSLVFIKPSAFKAVEAIATLSLVVHMWCVPLQSVVGWPR
jgi:4-hydroxybenzoate polyprenyltransferase